MAEQMNGFAAENDVVFISHGDCIEDVEYLERLIREKFGITEFLVNEVGPDHRGAFRTGDIGGLLCGGAAVTI